MPFQRPANTHNQCTQNRTSLTWLPFMICSTVTSWLNGRSGSSLGVSRKHCGVPSLQKGWRLEQPRAALIGEGVHGADGQQLWG